MTTVHEPGYFETYTLAYRVRMICDQATDIEQLRPLEELVEACAALRRKALEVAKGAETSALELEHRFRRVLDLHEDLKTHLEMEIDDLVSSFEPLREHYGSRGELIMDGAVRIPPDAAEHLRVATDGTPLPEKPPRTPEERRQEGLERLPIWQDMLSHSYGLDVRFEIMPPQGAQDTDTDDDSGVPA